MDLLNQSHLLIRGVNQPSIPEAMDNSFPQVTPSTLLIPKRLPLQQLRRVSQQSYFWQDNFPNIVVGSIIGFCGLSYAGTWWARERAENLNDRGPLDILHQNFVSSLDNYRAGRWWTLLTPSFIHMGIIHFGVNMLGVWQLGVPIVKLFGAANFASIWVGSAMLSSMASLYWKNLLEQKHISESSYRSIGASGALNGLLASMIFLAPQAPIGIFLLPGTLPAWGFGIVYICGSIACLATNTLSSWDHVGHLGGFFAGVAAYYARLRPLLRRV